MIFVLPAIFVRKKSNLTEFSKMCLVMGILFILGTTGFFPWARLGSHLKFIQFPWRLFMIASPLIAVAGGIYVSEFVKEVSCDKENIKNVMILAVLTIMVISANANIGRNDQGYYSYSGDYFNYAPFTAEVIGGEWLPVSVNNREKLVSDANVAYSDENKDIEVSRDKNTLSVSNLTGNEKYIDVPFVYYKGYAAVSESGEKLECDGSGENGRVRVYTSGAKSVKVYYSGTILQKVSDALSILAWLIILIVALKGTVHEKCHLLKS